MIETTKPRYRLYIDESGDHAYRPLDGPVNRYLALLGVWFRQDNAYPAFAEKLEELKRSIFGSRPDQPLILHRADIVNKRGAFVRLLDPAIERQFNTGLLQLIEEADFKMICVLIDKTGHLQKYSSPFHPYHYCLVAMLERYSGWLAYKNCIGDVMAECRGRTENRQLTQAYLRVYESGTAFRRPDFFQNTLTSREIKIKQKSANIAGLQLADLLAHPIKQNCLIEKNLITGPASQFSNALSKVAEPKFNRNEWRGVVWGYGKVLL